MLSLNQQMHPYTENLSLAGAESLQYRNNSSSTYGYGGKPGYYPLPAGFTGGYPDDGSQSGSPVGSTVDYSNVYPTPPYHPVQDAGYMINYRVGQSGSVGGTAKPASNSIYLEADPTQYGFSQAAAAAAAATNGANGAIHRAPSSAESASFSFHNVAGGAGGLSFPGTAERHLVGSSRRPLPSSAPRPYRADSVSSGYSKHSSGVSPTGTLTEPPTSSYGGGAFDSAAMSSYGAAPGPSALTAARLARSNDLYTTSSSTSSPESLLGGPDGPTTRLQGSGPELHYRYTDTTRRSSPHSSSAGGGVGSALMIGASSQPFLTSSHGHCGSFVDVNGAGDHAEDDRKPLTSIRS
jgi:hypothetical protein